MRNIISQSIVDLNVAALKNSFELEDINWNQIPSSRKLWAPEQMSPLFYLPTYSQLKEEEKIRANQLFSLGICEQFIWFENELLCPVLSKLLTTDLEEDMRLAIENFRNEELKHTEMFWLTLSRAEPEWYAKREFHFFNVSKVQKFLIQESLCRPNTFVYWVWLAILFEERTLDYSRQYLAAQRSTNAIDGLFSDVHRMHMMDEARHYQMDQYFLKAFYDHQPQWKKQLSTAMLIRIFKAYTSPKRTAKKILTQLSEEYPNLKKAVVPKLKRELKLLKNSTAFHDMAFSKKSIGRTLTLVSRYDELDPLWNQLRAASKSDFTSEIL